MPPRMLLASILIVGVAAQGLAASDSAARFARTFRRVDRRCTDWQFCTDRELPKVWRHAGEFLASQLSSCPDATTDDLVAAIKRLDGELSQRERNAPPIDASATKLANGDFVIALQYFETGTVFIIGFSHGGAPRVKWSIADALPCWRASCGPYFAGITLLPSARNANPRFLVDAWHAGNGMTVGAETSAWRWDGREAHLLALDKHQEMIDDDRQTRIDGDMVIVPTKEMAHWFVISGASRDPAGIWTLRLSANGAKSLGHRWVDRELRWADDFLFALSKRRAVDRFASAEVAREVRRHLDDAGGMLMKWHRDGQTLHLTADSSFTFTFDPKHVGLYAVAVRFSP
jgi:hypothetical protein